MKFVPALTASLGLLAGCATERPAPISEGAPAVVIERPLVRPTPEGQKSPPTATMAESASESSAYYTVKRGDTLYAIALDHGQSYRDLAAWNNLEDPNRILVGQQLRVAPPSGGESPDAVAVAKPIAVPGAIEIRPLTPSSSLGTASPATPPSAVAPLVAAPNTDKLKREPRAVKRPYSEETLLAMRKADAAYEPAPAAIASDVPKEEVKVEIRPEPKAEPKVETKPASEEMVDWAWPATGRLLGNFVEGGNKGIDIAAKTGDPVLAAAAGKVVYAGSSLRGYGKLVIVKHNATYLSAYAHNSQLLVKEGQTVHRGQKIAEAGSSDADQSMLHFEIRRQGKPVDPLKQLPSRRDG